MKKVFFLIIEIILIAVFSAAATIWLVYLHEKSAMTKEDNLYTVRLKVESGATTRGVGRELFNKKIIRNEKLFYLLARERPFTLHSGSYAFKSTMTMDEVLDVLRLNKQDLLRVTIAEGLTTKKIAQIMDEHGVCKKDDFIAACNDEELLKEYSIPLPEIRGPSLIEGYLFPDTYYFSPSTEAGKVIRAMVSNFFLKTKDALAPLIKKDGKESTLDKEALSSLVILSSIVEREYRNKNEAPLIASVFKNRLKDNIGLYSCATVEYIITEIKGLPHPDTIHYKDLTDESPYNTYHWRGLPPTAICNPGLVAIEAVLNAPKTNYYYFRLVDPARGLHAFSKDFDTHIREGTVIETKK